MDFEGVANAYNRCYDNVLKMSNDQRWKVVGGSAVVGVAAYYISHTLPPVVGLGAAGYTFYRLTKEKEKKPEPPEQGNVQEKISILTRAYYYVSGKRTD